MKHVVGFSGGADSQATAAVVREQFPPEDIILLNTQAGRNEHPITTEFIAWYSANVFPVIEVVPLVKDWVRRISTASGNGQRGVNEGATRDRLLDVEADTPLFRLEEELTFDRLAYLAGRFPSRTAQFCTEHLKLTPQIRWCEEHLAGIEFERWVGVRCDESEARKDTPKRRWDETFRCYVNAPINCWTKAEVFAYLKHKGERINPLYTMGFNRVGCAPCINSGKDDVRNWAARFPEMIDKVRRWEKEVGRTFFAPCVPGYSINWVDDVVAWSKTYRGGRQPLLQFTEADAAAGTCVSSYGLCE